ncbi:MAG: hypothetical protein LLF94_11830 [Chlamydiales bacterium]|nr:hypothetical protein [Chlamydiales bacterium]
MISSINSCIEEECAYCLGPYVNPLQTPCKHTFCNDCITAWLKKDPTCPMCRTPLKVQDGALRENIEAKNAVSRSAEKANDIAKEVCKKNANEFDSEKDAAIALKAVFYKKCVEGKREWQFEGKVKGCAFVFKSNYNPAAANFDPIFYQWLTKMAKEGIACSFGDASFAHTEIILKPLGYETLGSGMGLTLSTELSKAKISCVVKTIFSR